MTTLDIGLPTPHTEQARFVKCEKKRIIVRAGRRGGKTFGLGIRAVEEFVLHGKRVLYAAPTADQTDAFWSNVSRWMAPLVDSGLVRVSNHERLIEFPRSRQRIKAKTAWNADSLRGDYADFLILDEYQLMDEDTWSVVGAPMLLDNGGTAVFIFTPPSVRSAGTSKAKDKRHAAKFWNEHLNDERWDCFHFSSMQNPHLDKQALEEITHDMTSLAYRQEILAELIEEVPGALWTMTLIEEGRVDKAPDLEQIVVGVDPKASATADSETGIIVAGKAGEHEYIVGDYSIDGTPDEWGRKVVWAYHKHEADAVVVEVNQGGDMIKAVLHQIDDSLNIKEVRATRGKYIRAEPIAARYEQGRVHHAGQYAELENQMVTWVPGDNSPDRLDALVWALSQLERKRPQRKARALSRY